MNIKIVRMVEEFAEAFAAVEYYAQQAQAEAQMKHDSAVQAAKDSHQTAVNKASDTAEKAVAIAKSQFENATREIEKIHSQAMEQAKERYTKEWSELPNRASIIAQTSGYSSVEWSDPKWNNWEPNTEHDYRVTRLGTLTESNPWNKLTMPALIPFLGGRSLLCKSGGAGRAAVAQAAQSCLLRLLATVPAGKLRFTFVDPVGLGQNVAPFMHLADYDDTLVTARAWSEPHHIEQRLADLTEHMENVIQKYLRNQYADIQAYNAQAGEVAEPYRVLVVHDFPASFSETAARRLVSVLQNGPRCGVYALVHADPTRPMPHGFDLADLERNATVIARQDGRFVWADTWENPDESFAGCHLELDTPPPPALFNHIVTTVGQAAKDAAKVEVPFARIAPARAQWWQASAESVLTGALGPSGANKIQPFELGRGTAQHALVAGKTGAGKSTLLHTLITHLALAHSPAEVELYLIDFKKGVEFKNYAVHALPHARVVAIESEREFCLSVLQGLDAELKRRGDLFRAAQVDNLAAYRKRSNQTMPRILLLVDEFQEFFSDDDPIASQASQLLDRMVRQGRAFGMHVLLGSQTLAGAYSLTRSTIDQMAVRIALQCSEADSRLILADDNGAARLLTRPGEAIYNNANGMVEGNNFFQVAYLRDEERDHYLAQIADFAHSQGYRPPRPQIVFEGNAPALVAKNQLLADLLAAPMPPTPSRRVAAWLGDPIAIKDPTVANFRRQSGSNLLMVGQNDELCLGMTMTALISLAAQHAVHAARFYLLDFGAVDDANADRLRDLAKLLPHPTQWGRRRELTAMIAEVAAELERRQNLPDEELRRLPSIYLVVYGLHRARDLRPDEGAGFSSYSYSDEPPPPPSPAQQFPTLIQQGPDLGIHTLVWCDTVANLNRMLDRRVQREFETRVALQMSADDSSNLIDSTAAAKLGLYRALLVSDEEARQEKFRPYDVPDAAWLAIVAAQLQQRAA
jgi:hypothetical protein